MDGTNLSNSSTIEIRYLGNDQLLELLQYISILIGITKPPGEMEYSILRNFIRDNFQNVEVGKIIKAFERYVGGKSKVQFKKSYNLHSGLFSEVANEYLRSQKMPTSDYHANSFNREDWFTYLRKHINHFFETGEYTLMDYGNPFWHYLTHEKKILEISDEERAKIRKNVESGNFKDDTAYADVFKGSIESQIKNLEVRHFLTEQRSKGTKVQQIIDSKV